MRQEPIPRSMRAVNWVGPDYAPFVARLRETAWPTGVVPHVGVFEFGRDARGRPKYFYGASLIWAEPPTETVG